MPDQTATTLGGTYAILTARRLGVAEARRETHGHDSEWLWLIGSAAESLAIAYLLRALQDGIPADTAARGLQGLLDDGSAAGATAAQLLTSWGRPDAAREAYEAGRGKQTR